MRKKNEASCGEQKKNMKNNEKRINDLNKKLLNI